MRPGVRQPWVQITALSQPDLRQPASVCALGLSFPASDVEMMVPTSQGWGVDSGRSGKESAGGRKWTLGTFSHFSL